MSENDKLPKTEFRILELRASGPSGMAALAWFHGETKIGGTEELKFHAKKSTMRQKQIGKNNGYS